MNEDWDDFCEDDEPLADILKAWNSAEKGVTGKRDYDCQHGCNGDCFRYGGLQCTFTCHEGIAEAEPEVCCYGDVRCVTATPRSQTPPPPPG